MVNYYFNEVGIEVLINQEKVRIFPYTHNLPATDGTMPPDNALRVAPIFKVRFQPILNGTKDGWDEIADHRQQKDERDIIIEGSGTAYWLPEDNYQSEARYMEVLGELPAGALLVKPVITLVEAKAVKFADIKQKALNEESSGFVNSSLDFRVDATRKSKEDVDGIIQAMEYTGETKVQFRDYDNNFHELTLGQVKILQVEIINRGLYLYQHKWELQALIEQATTLEELEAIIW